MKATDDRPTLLHGKYELGRLLGHGTFAKVYVGRNLQTGKSVAIKVVGKDKVIKVGMMEQIKREISVMKMVKHKHIVELHEVMASKSKIYFAMDLVKGGELFNKIAKGRLREDTARVYFQQLISAIDFCHSRGVYHRDLKPENLLLDEDGNLKVTDFGLSAFSEHLKQDGLLHTTCGTPAYVAPEVIGKKGYDGAKADIWSCGVILYVLLAGFLPFQDDNIMAMYRKIYRGDFKCPPWFSSEARRLITKLLDPNPNTRITISKIMESSWFKKSAPKIVKTKQEMEFEASDASDKLKQQPETLNAFHIISLSEGFDLSPLFEEKKREEKEELRFATTRPASSVISRFEEVGKAVKFNVKTSESGVRLQGQERKRRKFSASTWGDSARNYLQIPNEYESAISSNYYISVAPALRFNVELSTSMSCKLDRSKLEDDEPVFMSRDEIERFSPSRKDGIDALRETHLRYSYCAFIQNLGFQLELPQTTIGTAMVLCHRFFVRRSHACHDRFLIATAALFLAAKSEETPRPLSDVIRASSELYHKQDITLLSYLLPVDWFEQYRERVTEAEQMILTTLNFELNVQHPYDPLTSILNKLGLSQTVLVNMALNLVSEGLRSSLWLQFKPHQIAAGAAYLAAKFLNWDLASYQNIWQEFQTTPAILQDVAQQLMELF